ncbi:hypothetical protein PPUJ20028_00740 [Pseudomonas putida]|uniref:RHS repeat-associated core domain-containing protein n=1 Tax=Pseudomonas putida TaxID=303 RepID=A0AA37VVC7_PSEPU|nr:RHS repeat-associated core domain-containing protein [Pseudomonas putida]GLO11493.1 hypothetical protein PPUJ20028_00740 [Pseudomonas putida]GLO34534.1 hypothetical protein PPUN14671_13670 [Pseudomonas putida]HDS0964065.1 RHS repeat-associated core domain-containing protein [Pseudomonas putida]HDS0989649.1 RHS repeat-associated core domain-containing protein [Pseudomonas putida]
MKLFYRTNQKLATTINDSGSHSFLSTQSGNHAEIETVANNTLTSILATDNALSVLTAKTCNDEKSLAFSCYGHVANDIPPTLMTLFTGERFDWNIDTYHLGSGRRLYNPKLMRFYSPDQWSPFGRGGLNAYAYCSGDPVNLSDHSGEAGVFNLVARRKNPTISKRPNIERHPIKNVPVSWGEDTIKTFKSSEKISSQKLKSTTPSNSILKPSIQQDVVASPKKTSTSEYSNGNEHIEDTYYKALAFLRKNAEAIKALPADNKRVLEFIKVQNKSKNLRTEIYRSQNSRDDAAQDLAPPKPQ